MPALPFYIIFLSLYQIFGPVSNELKRKSMNMGMNILMFLNNKVDLENLRRYRTILNSRALSTVELTLGIYVGNKEA